MAALVPAEVLTAHAVLIGLGTKTEKLADDRTRTTITEPTALKVLLIALAVTSLLLYVLGHVRNWESWDFVRMLIPPLAFVAWTALQRATMFDAWFPTWSEIARTGTALIAALLLGAAAYALSYKADAKPAV